MGTHQLAHASMPASAVAITLIVFGEQGRMTDTAESEPLLPLESEPINLIGTEGILEYRLRKRLAKVSRALNRLTAATGWMPAQLGGSVQDVEFNKAYSHASHVLQEESMEPE